MRTLNYSPLGSAVLKWADFGKIVVRYLNWSLTFQIVAIVFKFLLFFKMNFDMLNCGVNRTLRVRLGLQFLKVRFKNSNFKICDLKK
jgi:hypothetical protein